MLSMVTLVDSQAVVINLSNMTLSAAKVCSMEMAHSMAVCMVEHRRQTEDCLHTVLGLRLVLEVNSAEQLIPIQSKQVLFEIGLVAGCCGWRILGSTRLDA